MKPITTNRLALSIIAAALLAACGGSQPPIGGPGARPQSRALATIAERSGSRMLPNTSGQDLLYTSSDNGDVYVYTYPQGKKVGELTGFTNLLGLCADAAGNVFVVAYEFTLPSTIYEYAHGGTNPIATLTDPGYGFGCAVDPKTGNLAVANIYDPTNSYKTYGDIAIYKHAQGQPTIYASDQFGSFWFCGYDDKKNLYASAFPANGKQYDADLVKLPHGGTSLSQVTVSTDLHAEYLFEPSVQWDGKEMTVSSVGSGSDQVIHSDHAPRNPITVYQLSIRGDKGTVIGTTTLNTKKDHLQGQTWIQGSSIVGVYTLHGENVGFWEYPQGGTPQQSVLVKSQEVLYGVTVSVAPRR